jgi:hypothetical protein
MEDWKKDLKDLFESKKEKKQEFVEQIGQQKQRVEIFYSSIVGPAFEELKTELEKHGRKVTVSKGKEHASINVSLEGMDEYQLNINVRIYPTVVHPYPTDIFVDKNGKRYKGEGFLRSGSQDYDISDISKEEVIKYFLYHYKDHIKE